MQAAKFGEWLHAVAAFNRGAGGDRAARVWAALAEGFLKHGERPVSALLKPLEKAQPAARADEISLAAAVVQLDDVARWLQASGPAALLSDFGKLAVQLRRHSNAAVTAFVAEIGAAPAGRRDEDAVDPTVISAYSTKLDNALGDANAFPDLLAEVNQSLAERPAALKELARAFTGRAGVNGPKSLERIWIRHRDELDARGRERAKIRRTAA